MRFNKFYEFKAADNGVLDMAFCDNLLFTCGKDDFIRKWNTTDFSLVGEIKAHDKDIRVIRFFPDLKTFLSSSENGDIKEFDTNLRLIREYKPHSIRVNDISFIDDASFITASDDGYVRIYKRGSYSFDKEKDFNIGDVESLCLYKNFIIVGGTKLVVADLKLNEKFSFDNDYLYGIDGIYIWQDRIFISRSMEKKLEIRDGNFNLINVYKMPSWINDMKFFNDLVFCAASNIICVFDKEMNEIARSDFQAEVYAMEFFNNRLWCAYDDGYVRVWDVIKN